MYIIKQVNKTKWMLKLTAKDLKTVIYFSSYVSALDAVHILQLHKNSLDKNNIFLTKKVV